ncbi:MAG: hypothetical protein MR274_03875 [Clostridium sp.]|nr:hypothetical protein [Clostridium sp.]
MIKNISIINLCDRPINELSSLIENNKQQNRIQIGSYTCGNYFKYLIKCFYNKKIELQNYDIVIPTFSEHDIDFLNEDCLDTYINNASNIVVNDFGTLDRYYGIKELRLGRLFFKDYRDFRYSEYDNSNYVGKAKGLIDALLSSGYEIKAIENDIITKNYYTDIDDDIEVYLHYPYRQVSACHICEFASISKKIEDKFIPDCECSLQCSDVKIASESGYIKVGKSVFNLLDSSYLSEYINNNKIIITPRWF